MEFLKKRPIVFPVAQVDPLHPLRNFGPPQALPNTYVIAPDGHVAKAFLGPVTARELNAVITSSPRR